MIELKSKIRKWGNSFGIVIPIKAIEKEKAKEGDEVRILIKKDLDNTLKETFGTFRFKKSVDQIMKEANKELYNE